MRNFALVVVALAWCGAVYAAASPSSDPRPAQNRIVGLTEARVSGSPFGLVRACDVEFPGTRVCTPSDLMRTSIAPDGLSDTEFAWIDGTSLQSLGSTLICGIGGGEEAHNGFRGAAILGNGDGFVGAGTVVAARCDEEGRVACCGKQRRVGGNE